MPQVPLRHARPALLASFFFSLPSGCHPFRSIRRSRVIGGAVKQPRVFYRPESTMAPIERIADKLETPALDDRSYRVIRLPNKLEALLVHDPDTDKASASVNVNVGSFSDADDMPGMAHAVEHLLFMGTEKVCS